MGTVKKVVFVIVVLTAINSFVLSATAASFSGYDISIIDVEQSGDGVSVTFRIQNNYDMDISLFGYPSVVVDGAAAQANFFDNVHADYMRRILPGTYEDITLFFQISISNATDVSLQGSMHSLGFGIDKSFKVAIDMEGDSGSNIPVEITATPLPAPTYQSAAQRQQEEFRTIQEENRAEFDRRAAESRAEFERQRNIMFGVFFGIIILILAFAIINKIMKDKKRRELSESLERESKHEEMVPAAIKPKTVTGAMCCPKCGMQLDSTDRFCRACGATTVNRSTKSFARGAGDDYDFIMEVNQWLKENRNIGNASCKFNYDSSMGLFVNKFKLENVSIEYENLQGTNEYVYAIDVETSTSIVVSADSSEGLLVDWKQKHPEAVVVSIGGGTHTRGDSLGVAVGFGLNNVSKTQIYVFYKKKA